MEDNGFLLPSRGDAGVTDEAFLLVMSTLITEAFVMHPLLGVIVDSEVEHRADMPLDMLDNLTIAAMRAEVYTDGMKAMIDNFEILKESGFAMPEGFIPDDLSGLE